MKITIQLEISPDEVQLATELLATLRSLTSHHRAYGQPAHRSTFPLPPLATAHRMLTDQVPQAPPASNGVAPRLQQQQQQQPVVTNVPQLIRAQVLLLADPSKLNQVSNR